MGGRRSGTHFDGWDGYMRIERMQLSERASGKMRRAIGRVLRGEDAEELERIASEDERMARAGLVMLRRGGWVWHKHIDDLVPEDRQARIEAELATIAWLRGRIEGEKIVARWRENGWDRPEG